MLSAPTTSSRQKPWIIKSKWLLKIVDFWASNITVAGVPGGEVSSLTQVSAALAGPPTTRRRTRTRTARTPVARDMTGTSGSSDSALHRSKEGGEGGVTALPRKRGRRPPPRSLQDRDEVVVDVDVVHAVVVD